MKRVLVPLMALVLLGGTARAAPTESLAVLPMQGRGVSQDTLAALNDVLAVSATRAGRYRVIAWSDVQALIGLEKAKDAAGCDDVSCAAELGGALGARFLLAAQVKRVQDRALLTLSLIDTTGKEATRRAQEQTSATIDGYLDAIPRAVGGLLGRSVAQVTGSAPDVPAQTARVAARTGLLSGEYAAWQRDNEGDARDFVAARIADRAAAPTRYRRKPVAHLFGFLLQHDPSFVQKLAAVSPVAVRVKWAVAAMSFPTTPFHDGERRVTTAELKSQRDALPSGQLLERKLRDTLRFELETAGVAIDSTAVDGDASGWAVGLRIEAVSFRMGMLGTAMRNSRITGQLEVRGGGTVVGLHELHGVAGHIDSSAALLQATARAGSSAADTLLLTLLSELGAP